MVLVFSHKKNPLLSWGHPFPLFVLLSNIPRDVHTIKRLLGGHLQTPWTLLLKFPRCERRNSLNFRGRGSISKSCKENWKNQYWGKTANYLSPYLGSLRNLSLFCLLYLVCLNRNELLGFHGAECLTWMEPHGLTANANPESWQWLKIRRFLESCACSKRQKYDFYQISWLKII